jgi:dTDP-4-dehydrorhamnose reductase
VVRTSAFFGPWDEFNYIALVLRTLAANQPFRAAGDITVSPTYVPDLVEHTLDLLIDGEKGLWHLTNGDPITWAQLAERAARRAGVDTARLEACPSCDLGYCAPRPSYSALRSARAPLMPSLDDALSRFFAASA